MDIYNRIKAITPRSEQLKAIKALSSEDKISYKRYQDKVNHDKYRSDPAKLKKSQETTKRIMKKLREEKPEEYKEYNKKKSKEHRERVKIELEAAKARLAKKAANVVMGNILESVQQNVFNDEKKKQDIKKKREDMTKKLEVLEQKRAKAREYARKLRSASKK